MFLVPEGKGLARAREGRGKGREVRGKGAERRMYDSYATIGLVGPASEYNARWDAFEQENTML